MTTEDSRGGAREGNSRVSLGKEVNWESVSWSPQEKRGCTQFQGCREEWLRAKKCYRQTQIVRSGNKPRIEEGEERMPFQEV